MIDSLEEKRNIYILGDYGTGCVYLLEAGLGKRVYLTLFLINTACYFGGLEIFEGNGTRIHSYCGNNLHNVEVG